MADFKPILFVFLVIFIFGGVLNLLISPFLEVEAPAEDSFIIDFIDFIENGISLGNFSILQLVFPDLEIINISPVTWLWFGNDKVTDFVLEQLVFMSYIPDSILIPLCIILFVSLIYSIIALIRGS